MTTMIGDSFLLATRNGRLYYQHPGKSSDPSVFSSKENAEMTNARQLKDTGTVLRIVSNFTDGAEMRGGYWTVPA